MVKGRRDVTDNTNPSFQRLRIVASGTVFVTNQLVLQAYPTESSVSRAQNVSRTRGGTACNVLSTLAQFPNVDAMLVAPFGSDTDAKQIAKSLEYEGVNLRYCKVWEGCGVPNAWVMKSEETGSTTIINHNPLPDLTHEEFVSILGPLLVPENYAIYDSPVTTPCAPGAPSPSVTPSHTSTLSPNQLSPAPFDWLHFEGRSVRTTLSNLTGIDGLARERKWRSHCVFSLDMSRKLRQGVEALIPHVDVIFFSKQYALSHTASSEHTTPRTFLLSMSRSVPAHALLIVFWGTKEKEGGAALLSMPTREYLQSSGWEVPEPPVNQTLARPSVQHTSRDGHLKQPDTSAVESVRSGSGFWAVGHYANESESLSAYTYTGMSTADSSGVTDARGYGIQSPSNFTTASDADIMRGRRRGRDNPDTSGEAETKKAAAEAKLEEEPQEVYDAFVAGMIFALSRRLLPGDPYTPFATKSDERDRSNSLPGSGDRDRWRLDECLRFASELAGRAALKVKQASSRFTVTSGGTLQRSASTNTGAVGLAEEMIRAGWLD